MYVCILEATVAQHSTVQLLIISDGCRFDSHSEKWVIIQRKWVTASRWIPTLNMHNLDNWRTELTLGSLYVPYYISEKRETSFFFTFRRSPLSTKLNVLLQIAYKLCWLAEPIRPFLKRIASRPIRQSYVAVPPHRASTITMTNLYPSW